MFGCTDATQVLKELEECKAAYPDCFVRVIGFDNSRQVQCISFIASKPPGAN
jgi:ribulose-bisphosphate carboxylase small chain